MSRFLATLDPIWVCVSLAGGYRTRVLALPFMSASTWSIALYMKVSGWTLLRKADWERAFCVFSLFSTNVNEWRWMLLTDIFGKTEPMVSRTGKKESVLAFRSYFCSFTTRQLLSSSSVSYGDCQPGQLVAKRMMRHGGSRTYVWWRRRWLTSGIAAWSQLFIICSH